MAKRVHKIASIALVALILGALGMMFLPLLSMATVGDEAVLFGGATLLFGGDIVAELPSGIYAFHFDVNIPILIITQAYLLGAVSCFLGTQSKFNRIFSMLLLLTGSVAMFFLPEMVIPTSTLTREGLGFAYGLYLCVGFAAASFTGQLVELILLFRKGKQA